jgi:hypothetical protein
MHQFSSASALPAYLADTERICRGHNYLFVHRGYGGGLTPLLDSDGKPIVTKDGYKK